MKWWKLLLAYDGKAVGTVLQLTEEQSKALQAAKIIGEKEEPDPVESELQKAIKELRGEITTEMKGLFANLREGLKATSADIRVIKDNAMDNPENKFGYGNWGNWAADVKLFNRSNQRTEKLTKYLKFMEEKLAATDKAASGQNELVGADGGVLVPTIMSTEIFKKAFPEQSVMSLCDNRTISSNAIEFNYIIQNSRADGSRHGGLLAYWIAEAQAYISSKMQFNRVGFRLEKIAALVFVTDELMADAGFALEQEIVQGCGDAIKFLVNDAIVEGDGLKKPKGWTQSACAISVARGLANRILANDILKMWERCPSWLRSQAYWFINQDAEKELDKLFLPATNVAGTENVGGWPMFLPAAGFPNGGLVGTSPGTLKGRPVIPCEYASTLGTANDLMLIVPSQYRTVSQNSGITGATSIHLRFDYGEQAFRFEYRVDGQSMWPQAMTPYKGTNTVSPIILLAGP